MRLFTRIFTFFALSYLVLAAHGASFLPSGDIFFSAGWQDAYTAAGQRYAFTEDIGGVLSAPLPANTSHVAYVGLKLAEEGTYAFCIDCENSANATVIDVHGPHHQNDSMAQPVTLFEVDLDPTVRHLFSLFNVNLVDRSRVAFVSLAVTVVDNRPSHGSSSIETSASSTSVVATISTESLSTSSESSSEPTPSTVTTTVTTTNAPTVSSTIPATTSSAPTTSLTTTSVALTSIFSAPPSSSFATASSSPNSTSEPSAAAADTAVTGIRSSTIAAIASLTGLGVISLLVGLLIFFHRRRRRREMQDEEAPAPHMAQPSYVQGPLAAAGRQPPARRSYSWLSFSNGNNVQTPPPAVRGPYRLGSTNNRGGSRPDVYDQV